MKKLLLPIVCCLLLAGCNSSENRCSKGIVVDASMNTDAREAAIRDNLIKLLFMMLLV